MTGLTGAVSGTTTTSDGSSAAFPSRLHVASGYIADENGVDVGVLRGFNVHCHSAESDPSTGGVFAQAHFDAMGAIGAEINRVVIHWDAFQYVDGTSVNAGALTDLDTHIARAGTAGMYTVLEIHLNVGRIPSTARGYWMVSSGDEATDFLNHGQYLVQTLATRYAADKHVIGISTNETPIVTLSTMLSYHQTWVPWYRSIAPTWPIWLTPTAYGQGTPYPSGAADVDPAAYLALDTNSRGLIAEYHDYLTQCDTSSTDGYQANGSIDPWQQVPGGSFYNTIAYGDTTGTRTNLNTHCDPWKTFRDACGGQMAVAIGEWSYVHDYAGNKEDEYARDKIAAFRTHAGASVEIWWNYDTTTNYANNPFGARPGGVWREAVDDWFADTTPRA